MVSEGKTILFKTKRFERSPSYYFRQTTDAYILINKMTNHSLKFIFIYVAWPLGECSGAATPSVTSPFHIFQIIKL